MPASSFHLHPSSFPRASRYAPAVFFIGGFVWDAVTLGRTIKPVDLFILAAYLTGAAVILVMLGRGVVFRGSQYLSAVLQFFFGGIFSALFIFYFLSSGGLAGYLFVLALAAVLIGNEFLGSKYSELTLSWTLFTLCACMFFNFALAHLFHSIEIYWFYLGTLVAVLLALVLRQISRHDSASIKPSIAVAALLLILHALNLIPPVPLVKKQMLIAHDVHREGRAYIASVESPGWRIWRASSATFHRRAGEPVYCFTSVFVPNGISTTIRHRWERVDEKGDWVTLDLRPFKISGGRESGYRGYTLKQNVIPGLWRVTAESESGAAIGFVEFRVVAGEVGKMSKVRL
ncbi:MAG TPA: DUF2914 domain-containing protein [Thermoanaerobaculia bacterium]|nr:DUF2914 domain-containing protein [Thermoanaerobaculia bacterium]